MRPLARLVLAAVVAAAGPVLSACDSLDTFEIFDSKKKLAGDRKPVFPEGVPGVAAGVPPELVRGYHEPEGGVSDPAKAAAEAAADPGGKAKPKAAAKPKPAPQRTASKPAPKPQVPPEPYAAAPTRAAAPEPAQQPAPQATTAPWPTAQPQAAWPGAPGSVAR
jgi:hypothetical protein